MPDVRVEQNVPGLDGAVITIQVSREEMMGGRLDFTEAMQAGAKEIAEAYIKENMSEIFKKIDPSAIANLAVAESARLIRTQFIDPPKPKKEKEQ